MFCFQCQETARGSGCTIAGVCGKKASTAAFMDVLLFAARGVSVAATALRQHGISVSSEVAEIVEDALFATITNANFDDDALRHKIKRCFSLRDELIQMAQFDGIHVPKVDETRWHGMPMDYLRKAGSCGVLRHQDPDMRSLIELTTYGLKGMAAYLTHARRLGYSEAELDNYVQRVLSDIATMELSLEELIRLVLETGHHGLDAMALLDKAHTATYGNPVVTQVNIGFRHRPGILVSGHDLHDLAMLLRQSQDSGVDIYTHSEMLSAHYYPMLKKYPHLVGNYGSSWWRQREEFSAFNGPILFTTNCIVPPFEESVYKDRIFTTNSAGYRDCWHIEADEYGNKDFSPIIEMAKRCLPPTEIESGSVTGGYAHDQVNRLTHRIAEAVRAGHIRKFIVMAGCDGRMGVRDYYTEYAKALPSDCIILTAGCAKYRYNKLDLGEIDGIPRVLDAGQCNDAYSWILTAYALRDLFQVSDINQLPIVYNIAWYEQKAVIVLLAMLSLGIKNIHLGPTFPAFLSSNVAQVLVDKFGISGIDNVQSDLRWAA